MKLPFGYELRKRQSEKVSVPESQIRESTDSRWGYWSHLAPNQDLNLYDEMRSTIPPLDMIPGKWFRLLGTFDIKSDNDRIRTKLEDFKKHVRVGWYGQGFDSFLYQMFDSCLAKGGGLGEMVLSESMMDVDRMVIARANDIVFVKKDGRLWLAQKTKEDAEPRILHNMDTIYYIAPDQREGHPQGYSVYYSLPFVTQILYRIEKSVDNAVWRVGDPTFISWIEASEKAGEQTIKNAKADYIRAFQKAMKARKAGKVRDIFGGGPGTRLHVQILGGSELLDHVQIPFNMVIDQIVSKSDLPDWMLGFHRSTTERLSTNQADMIVSKVKWYRDELDPMIERIFSTYLTVTGDAGAAWKHVWGPVNLLDEKEHAQARLYDASARDKELNIIERLDAMGAYAGADALEQVLRDNDLLKTALGRDVWRSRLHADRPKVPVSAP